jgi:hypothetical protein
MKGRSFTDTALFRGAESGHRRNGLRLTVTPCLSSAGHLRSRLDHCGTKAIRRIQITGGEFPCDRN